ncbi:MAG: hypothetical protein B7X29_04995 [Halothiobacillus sp. 13-55-115]|nr:MAG: hypothetical protein B7X29_04995 [Halothiobacillus sp. 13-55-115]
MFRNPISRILPIFQRLMVALLLGTAIVACTAKAPDHPFLPWDIKVLPDGTSAVFGVHLGKDSLLEFKRVYDQKAELAIFVDPDKKASLEAYFGTMNVGALTANVTIVAKTDPKELNEWIAKNHAKPDPTPSGAWKYPMTDEHIRKAQYFPIESITYAEYTTDLIDRHFGKPDEIRNTKGSTQYWLYPKKGLLIAVNSDGKDLFQYISPKDFSMLAATIPQDATPEQPASK